MKREFVRFKPVLVQIGTPLKANVFEITVALGHPQLVWPRGHVFQPSDLSEVLNPLRRLIVLKSEHEAAIKEMEESAMEVEQESELPYWCG